MVPPSHGRPGPSSGYEMPPLVRSALFCRGRPQGASPHSGRTLSLSASDQSLSASDHPLSALDAFLSPPAASGAFTGTLGGQTGHTGGTTGHKKGTSRLAEVVPPCRIPSPVLPGQRTFRWAHSPLTWGYSGERKRTVNPFVVGSSPTPGASENPGQKPEGASLSVIRLRRARWNPTPAPHPKAN